MLHACAIRGAASIAALVALAACEHGRHAPVPEPAGDVCEALSDVFTLIAYNRDLGESRRTQIERVAAGMDSPFVRDPERTQAQIAHVVDLVYRDETSTPDEIGARVRSACVVNEQGHASLRALWPAP